MRRRTRTRGRIAACVALVAALACTVTGTAFAAGADSGTIDELCAPKTSESYSTTNPYGYARSQVPISV
ncbi:MAG: hypothetical protein Q4D06_09155 [Coriobacteriia bacterium]|nr:hypothetical protein [Coriobacteriia bacterium]